MKSHRVSLLYLIAYLRGGGLALLVVPEFTAKLLQSNTAYPEVMLRAVGMFMLAISIIVIQIFRSEAGTLYSATLVARAFICLCLFTFYVRSENPFFLVLFAIVGLAVFLTGSAYLRATEDMAARSEQAFGTPVLAEVLPDIFDGVQFRRLGR